MNKKLLAAALFAASTSVSFAQSAFDGAYGQVGIGYSSASPSSSGGSQTITTAPLAGTYSRSSSFSSSADFTGTVTLGYMGTVSGNYLLGIGAEYSPLAGSNTTVTTTGGGLTAATSQYKVQNGYNIFLSPAVAVDKDKLIYGKVGYAGTSVQTTYAGSNNPTLNFTGYSLGLGYKQIIKGGFYGFAEGNYYSYGNQKFNSSGTVSGFAYTTTQTVNTNAFNLIAGIGYKF
jgi:outer membrane immunogenic protein